MCTIAASGGVGLAEAAVALVSQASGLPPTDSPPTVDILEPVNGSVLSSAGGVTLSGVATDPEDGDVSELIIWSSSRDGDLGVGGTLTVDLSAGFHTLTASATDSSGFTSVDTTGVTVNQDVEPCRKLKISFADSAEGWFNDAASTCEAGKFVIGTPVEEITSGIRTQPDGDHTSRLGNALFTGVTTSPRNDVKGGNCILRSPVYDVPSKSEVSLAYFHGQLKSGDDGRGDFFLIELSTDGGDKFEPMVKIGDVTTHADWLKAAATVPAGSAVQFRVQVSDGAFSEDVIEAGIDDIQICTRAISDPGAVALTGAAPR